MLSALLIFLCYMYYVGSKTLSIYDNPRLTNVHFSFCLADCALVGQTFPRLRDEAEVLSCLQEAVSFSFS